ncbi:hypothetical protein AB0I53_11320 [Saccharopolyspora sp. NPDC050389]|uniref:hypothetical protein n=1 Tax=Saccharopolyspora sp. NPDC050389 TaxID=3155516 RepID=UPI0033C066BE
MQSTARGRSRRFAVLPFAALALTALVTAGCGQTPGGTAAAPQPAAGTEQSQQTTGSRTRAEEATTFYAEFKVDSNDNIAEVKEIWPE